uniref:Uncharacterized protein n=1 Tax=Chromera velia CCMP2878 TaxID=1169474 RepID=A0A0G4GBP4_9ALVE|eukprot:Cvel_21177.t1-p1 / transcript=Cvel_21177.t1 / gene=Cvel_21177 / organism=Chromera_velia_CCMP2878 / gene_product=Ankyrin-3, putative / transcript_product=Ankyrin-3, putative / location=Cvel_scaffold1965:16776-18701(+) / protein_length=642 / sequence_SO=supercontig / SO=protein_coding / is_pseudo=false
MVLSENLARRLAAFEENLWIFEVLAPLVAIFRAIEADVLAIEARDGREKNVLLLLKLGADPRESFRGRQLVHWASEGGLLGIVNRLLEEGNASVLDRTENRETALHFASRGAHVAVARRLISLGSDVKATSTDGETPLHSAAQGGSAEIIRMLLEKGASLTARDERVYLMAEEFSEGENSALHLAAGAGHAEGVEMLLREAKNRLGTSECVSWRNCKSRTALHCAAEKGRAAVIRVLLLWGSDPLCKDRWEFTPLHLAVAKGHVDFVKALVEVREGGQSDEAGEKEQKAAEAEGADGTHVHESSSLSRTRLQVLLDSPDSGGRTALHLAAEERRADIVELLVSSGSSANTVDRRGDTPLHAFFSYFPKPVRRLRTAPIHSESPKGTLPESQTASVGEGCHGESDNVVAGTGWPPCEDEGPGGISERPIASASADAFVVEMNEGQLSPIPELLLFQARVPAGIDARNKVGERALHLACLAGDTSAVEMLLNSGADPGVCDDVSGLTAAAESVREREGEMEHTDTEKLLLENGGRTPLHIAARKGSVGIVRALLYAGAAPDPLDSFHRTPLLLAVTWSDSEESSRGAPTVIQVLLDAGADPQIEDFDGNCALSVAEELQDQGLSTSAADVFRKKGYKVLQPVYH